MCLTNPIRILVGTLAEYLIFPFQYLPHFGRHKYRPMGVLLNIKDSVENLALSLFHFLEVNLYVCEKIGYLDSFQA